MSVLVYNTILGDFHGEFVTDFSCQMCHLIDESNPAYVEFHLNIHEYERSIICYALRVERLKVMREIY